MPSTKDRGRDYRIFRKPQITDARYDVIRRLDVLVTEIRSKYHSKAMSKSADESLNGDVLIVAHGHILRAFAMRWIGKPLTDTAFILEAGGVGTLSYEHHNIDEPAIILGGAFVVGD
ncbi:phosphoglycerate mutase [Histoplasma capsulatum var. duboisii H88]|uniref:Phosphoglycerate mutase n=1 Tax=Ajellomyces capsulatus (strain H88) TaxID=544711 RepID=F0UVF3_AJEC8|nr:phosphoglycerate mutase [Histoplasma capsulatum var. duboisii H88]